MSSTPILFFSGIIIAIGFLLCKKVSNDKFSPLSFALAFQFWNAIAAIPLLFFEMRTPESIIWWIAMVISAGFFTLATTMNFKAFETTDASAVILINRLSIITAAVGGIILFNEVFNPTIFAGLVLLVLGTGTICFDGKKFKLTRGMWAAAANGIFIGLAAFMDKKILDHFSSFTYPFFNNLVMIILLSLNPTIRNGAIKLAKNKWMIIAGILNLAGWAAYLFVLRDGNISKAFPVWDSITLVAIVVMGTLFLGEKERFIQKLLGTLLAIGGIFLLG